MVEWANTSHVFVLDTLEDLGGGAVGCPGALSRSVAMGG